MAFEGELPDVDMLKMTPGELDLPAPTLSLDLPAPDQEAQLPPAAPAPAQQAKKSAQASKTGAKTQPGPAQKPKAATAKAAKPAAQPRETVQLLLSLVSVILLVIVAGVMILFEVPVNMIPDLTLTTYVQGLWIMVGCFFIVAMLQDIKTALILTGLDIVLIATIFPTLWLLLNMPMNPMYFFVIGMIMMLACVYMPLNMLRPKKLPAKV